MFCVMGAHGINFPVAQSGSVTPFPQQAATAAGLMGAVVMAACFAVGTLVAGTFDGTARPLALIVCLLSAGVFMSVRFIHDPVPVPLP
jgi:DHA1 family bicyclomycin/chloramphenicol resistance-like MFS transporter